MTTLIDKIEKLIKREKTTPERKKDDSKKSSNEILSELFGVFNADPPKIDDVSVKKKKSKKKHKKKEKKRSRSSSSDSDTDYSEYSHKRKKRKKSKTKKRRRTRSPSITGSLTPVLIKPEQVKVKNEPVEKITNNNKVKREIKIEKDENKIQHIKTEDRDDCTPPKTPEAIHIPMPESPKEPTLEYNTNKLDNKKQEIAADNDKTKSKIQIKNLKFSAVFEETVKKAEEEARKKAEKYEEGEYTDSSSSSVKEVGVNSQFPKTSDPGGILKQQSLEEVKLITEEKSVSSKTKHTDSSHKSSSHRHRSKSHKRSKSKSRRSRSRSTSRRHRRRSSSKSRNRSRSRRRSRSRTSHRSRHYSPRHRSRRSRSRSPSGVKLADSEKKRLLEVARRNAINMLKNGAVPAGAAVLPPHTRNQVMAAIQSGGKSVDELTDFCKHLSKKEALGELSSVSSNDDNMSENEDTIAFHHPFLVKEKAPIIMSIRGGAPVPVKSTALQVINKEELRIQFPVSSGSQHREQASEWTPVSPSSNDMQIANINSIPPPPLPPPPLPPAAPLIPEPEDTSPRPSSGPLAILPPPPPDTIAPPTHIKNVSSGSLTTTLPALPAPGPQVYPPTVDPSKMDMAALVSQKLSMIRKEQEENELTNGGTTSAFNYGWTRDSSLGQFTGTTGAHILTPKELASGTQAWAKKDQLQRAAPVESGMGMHLLQKMGWTPGQGLGKEGTGTLQPLLLEVKLDTRGLQAKEEYSGRYSKGMKPPRPGGRLRGGSVPLVAGGKHPVSLLGEYCSKQKLGPPEYNLCFECGPDHKKNFLFKVNVAGIEYQPAVASANKKQAKADAAQLALQKLGILT